MEDKIKEIIAMQLSTGLAEVKDEALLLEDLGADSLDTIQIIVTLEDTFCIEVSDKEINKITKVSDMVACIKSKVEGKK